MKIGIDAHAAEREGSGNCTYIRGLLKGLAKIDKENEYVLYVTDSNHPFYDNFNNNENFQVKLLKPQNPMIRIPFSLAMETIKDKLDILHVQYIAPPIHRGRLVVTIHDLAFTHFPESFSKFERFRSRVLVPINAKRAYKILTVSEYSKRDIIKQYKISSERLEVTYDAIPSHFRPVKNQKEKEKILRKYGIDSKFIFFLGRLNLRKNLETLLNAYTDLRKNKRINFKLVIGGKKDFLVERVYEQMKNSEFKNDIVLTDYIPEQDLPILFSSAEVFIYPSLFEGFGLPLIEAMACDCPVVTSNVSSIPEVVGDAAILIDPHNVNEISDAIYRVISNYSLKQKIKKRGLARAKLYRWEDTARKTLKIYEEVTES